MSGQTRFRRLASVLGVSRSRGRAARGMSQAELAMAMGTSLRSVSRWLGQRPTQVPRMVVIAAEALVSRSQTTVPPCRTNHRNLRSAHG